MPSVKVLLIGKWQWGGNGIHLFLYSTHVPVCHAADILQSSARGTWTRIVHSHYLHEA